MSVGDTARSNYAAVRAEILQRMQLRDYVLLVFLGFTGAIFSVALGAANHIEVLLAIPFLSLGAAILVSQHNLMAAVLGDFLSTELQVALDSENEGAPQWDKSLYFQERRGCRRAIPADRPPTNYLCTLHRRFRDKLEGCTEFPVSGWPHVVVRSILFGYDCSRDSVFPFKKNQNLQPSLAGVRQGHDEGKPEKTGDRPRLVRQANKSPN